MKYFRKNIQKMQAYVPGIQPKEKGWLKLNTNENPFPPSPAVIRAVTQAVNGSMKLYPDPTADELRKTIAKVCRVRRDMVLVGNGSDEVLSIISRAFLDKGRKALILDPTYSLFKTIVDIQGAKLIRQKVNPDFLLPQELFSKRADCAFIANPNPQAGTLFDCRQMERLARTIGGVLVVDEAYVDYAPHNCLPLVKKYRNVIITRSLSKSYSLAGMRIGYAVAQKPIIDMMMKIKDSYNVNRLSQVAAIAALGDRQYFRKNIREVIRQGKLLASTLKSLGFEVVPSASNFILVKPPDNITAKELYEELLKRRILIRFFCTKNLRQYIRISIGDGRQNEALVKNIKHVLKEGRI